MDNTLKYINEPFNVYCNGVQIAASPFDFTLILNNNSPTGNHTIGEIKMSPEHAKTLAHMLLDNVNQFEDMFGKIPQMTPEKLEKLKADGKVIFEEN